ncbi:MAG: hypothetical protein IJC41_01985 [Firmicutes bacterium]|nr:hypothetical protein [Bacillota bacterium]
MNENKNKKSVSNILVSVAFLVFIAGFFGVSLFLEDKVFSESENRHLAGSPELSLDRVADGSFSKDFEAYVQDQFPERDGLMSLKTTSEKALGKKDNGLVYFGEDGYLFALEDIDMEQLDKNISYINKFAEENDIDMKIMVVPTASEVLNDKLPEHLYLNAEKNAFDAIEKGVDIPFEDVRDELKEHSDEYIYYRTDHHWTVLGAFYAYESISDRDVELDDYEIKEVSRDFLGTNYSKALLSTIGPDSIHRFDLENDKAKYRMEIYDKGIVTKRFDEPYDPEYLLQKDKYSYFLSGNNPVTVIEKSKKEETEKNTLVVKDSFAHCFIPFIAAERNIVVAADMRYYRNGLAELIEEYEIDEVLFLYNIVNFSNDRNIVFINR